MTIGLVSLGCAKNAVDLQVMSGHLLKAGHTLAPDPDNADVILVNTCAFIESAREEAAAEIARACELKRAGRCKVVVAAGCFVQRYRAEVLKAFPDLDAVLGVDALDRISEIVSEATSFVPPGLPKKVFDPPIPALRLTGAAFAYLKVAEGCAHRCAYCAIPAIRGKFRSRPLKSVLAEARALVKTGVKELNVIAQDPMLYGVDFRDGTNLVTLLRALDKIPGDFWVRVLYSYVPRLAEHLPARREVRGRAAPAHGSEDPRGDGARVGRQGHAGGGGASARGGAGHHAPDDGDDGLPRRDAVRVQADAG